jgi:hypothetical protein
MTIFQKLEINLVLCTFLLAFGSQFAHSLARWNRGWIGERTMRNGAKSGGDYLSYLVYLAGNRGVTFWNTD